MADPGQAQQTVFDPVIGVERASAEEVDARLLKEQFVRLRESLLTPLAPMLLLVLAHLDAVESRQLFGWVGIMLVLLYLRRWNALRVLRLPEADLARDYRRLYRIEWLGAMAVSVGWISGMWLLGNGQVDALFFFRMAFLIGVAAVTLGTMGLHPRVYGSFMAVMSATLLLYFMFEAPLILGRYPVFVAVVLVFFGLLVLRSRDESVHAREWIEARLNQNLLVQRLREVVMEQQDIRMHLEAKSAELQRSNQLLNDLAIHDTLTGAYNRGYVQEMLHKSVSRYLRNREPLCVMMIDIDHFKRVNDQYGHAVGDEVIRKLAAGALASLRQGDIFGRWGGEEFIALLPGIDLKGAADVAERLRLAIAELRFPAQPQDFGVTVSVGVSQILDGESAESLVARADAALYSAKNAGRNCVVLANELVRPMSLAA